MIEKLAQYSLIEEIAEGGMGVVYRARDTRLDRDVAVKVIRTGARTAVEAERFLREIRIAARLQHPNILPIHDSGSSGELLWYVMPLIDGETLADRMAHEPVLDVEETLSITRDVAEALAYAHRQGVVHRDIKPSNVLLSGGRAVLADFGLALALDRPEDEKLTQAGIALGTPLYMSPEQASGDATLDGRADLYSLGCLLFEMLLGRAPFRGATTREILKGHLFDEPPSMRGSRPDIPPHIEAATMRALAKKPSERFADVEAFAQALGASDRPSDPARPASGSRGSSPDVTGPTRAMPSFPALGLRTRRYAVAAALAVGVVAALLWRALMTPSIDGVAPVVAVLPFENVTGDDAMDHVGLGCAHAIVSSLSTLRGVTMISAALGQTLDAGSDPGRIAQELGANYVVSGSVQAAGARLQVTTALVRADGSVAWADTYQGDGAALFEIQGRIARGLTDALQLSLQPADRLRLEKPPTQDRDAYAEYSQGRSFLERRFVPGNTERALALFESAVERDPAFALGHAALAEARWERYRETLDPEWTDHALEAARTARRLDPDNATVRHAVALIADGMGRGDEAVTELDEALSINPRFDEALRLRGRILARQGHVEDAVSTLRQAIDIRPNYWGHYQTLGLVLLRAGRFVEAQDVFRRITELQPDLPWGYQMLGTAYHMNEELDDAIESYQHAITAGDSPAALSNLAVIQYRRGNYAEAAEAFAGALELEEDALGRRNLGDAHRKLGREEEAREAYERGAVVAREAIAVNPEDAESWGVLAICEAKLGRLELALQHVGRALELTPDSADAAHRLSVVHAYAGNTDEALTALERAVELGYSLSEIALDDDLESLRDEPRFRTMIASSPTEN